MLKTPFTEDLPCKLTAHEKLLKSEQLSHKLADVEKLEEAKKAATSRYADQIKARVLEVKLLATEVRTGEEFRPIECTEMPRYSDMMVDIVRVDTGATVRSRPMQPSERQEELSIARRNEARKEDERPTNGKRKKPTEPAESIDQPEQH